MKEFDCRKLKQGFDMKEIEKLLDDFYQEQKIREHNRYFSWEYCYSFFKENGKNIVKQENLLDLACLNLAVYLASWGMYRGSSKLLQMDYKVHKCTIKELISECDCLWGNDFDWQDIEKAKNILERNYKKYGVSCTPTLITKILMGMFGCTPAYDRFFISGLSVWNNTNKIPKTFNKDSFNALKKLSEGLKPYTLLTKNIPYPPMKLIDTYFWCVGNKNQENEE